MRCVRGLIDTMLTFVHNYSAAGIVLDGNHVGNRRLGLVKYIVGTHAMRIVHILFRISDMLCGAVWFNDGHVKHSFCAIIR